MSSTVEPSVDKIFESELAMCNVCGTTRTVSGKARRDTLICTTCGRSTWHSRPFASGDLGDGTQGAQNMAANRDLRRFMRDVQALERLGIDVDPDCVTTSEPVTMWIGVDSGRLEATFQASLPLRAKAFAMEWVWEELRDLDRVARDEQWRADIGDDAGRWKGIVPSPGKRAAIQALSAAENLRIESEISGRVA